MIRTILAVGLGGFAGSVMRYAVTRLTAHVQWFNMPLGTLTVNLIGCLILGFLTALFTRWQGCTDELRLFLTVGMCGGFTTFSTFMGENFAMTRAGQLVPLVLYLGISLTGGFLLFFLGYLAASRL